MQEPPPNTDRSGYRVELRVRYSECDSMGVAHHSAYPVWLEIARTELLREGGNPYRILEQRGVLFVVAKLSVRYRVPAVYDQVLQVAVRGVSGAKPHAFKIDHDYEIHGDSQLIATASTTLACVNRHGKLQRIPEEIFGQSAARH